MELMFLHLKWRVHACMGELSKQIAYYSTFQRIVTLDYCALYKYSYLLAYI